MTDTQDRLEKLQQAFEERGNEAIEELRTEDPETYALLLSEVAGLPVDEKQEEGQSTRSVIVRVEEGETRERAEARFGCKPEWLAAESISFLSFSSEQPADLNQLINELEYHVDRSRRSDSRTESMLVSQAHTLDALFHRLLKRAEVNIREGFPVGREYLKLSMRAQSQCRSTLDSLAALQRPSIRQTNIAHGHQQVNNYADKNPPNELMEQKDERMDAGTPQEAITGGQALETVGEEHLSLIHISEPTRPFTLSRMPSSA